MPTIIVVAVLVVIVALAVRSLIKQKKSGGGCNGDCGHCKGCHWKAEPLPFTMAPVLAPTAKCLAARMAYRR